MKWSSDDAEFAHQLATQVGAKLIAVRRELAESGADVQKLKDTGDSLAHDMIERVLSSERPADAFLSEEGVDDHGRLTSERTWIIDPLDGTREFSEPPRTDWAVHVALVIDEKPTQGAVCIPAEGLTFSTHSPLPTPSVTSPARVIVSRTRRPPPAVALAEHLHGTYIEMGSAGAKTMAVVRGDADVYAHAGGQYEWDSCAPVAVAQAAGLHCSRLDGSELVYNQANPYLPDLLVCHPSLADVCLKFLTEYLQSNDIEL